MMKKLFLCIVLLCIGGTIVAQDYQELRSKGKQYFEAGLRSETPSEALDNYGNAIANYEAALVVAIKKNYPREICDPLQEELHNISIYRARAERQVGVNEKYDWSNEARRLFQWSKEKIESGNYGSALSALNMASMCALLSKEEKAEIAKLGSDAAHALVRKAYELFDSNEVEKGYQYLSEVLDLGCPFLSKKEEKEVVEEWYSECYGSFVFVVRAVDYRAQYFLQKKDYDKAADVYFKAGERYMDVGYLYYVGHQKAKAKVGIPISGREMAWVKEHGAAWYGQLNQCFDNAEKYDKSIWSKQTYTQYDETGEKTIKNYTGKEDYLQRKANDLYSDAILYLDMGGRMGGGLYIAKDSIIWAEGWANGLGRLKVASELNQEYDLRKKIGQLLKRFEQFDIHPYDTVSENTYAFICGDDRWSSVTTYCRVALRIPEVEFDRGAVTLKRIEEYVAMIKKASIVNDGNLNVLFYYNGEFFIDKRSGDVYLLPEDGDSSNLETCYSLNRLYRELGNIDAKSIVCFFEPDSGYIPQIETPRGNMLVFTANSVRGKGCYNKKVDYEETDQGLFTYYLLEKIRMSGCDVTLGELYDYISKNVKKTSYADHGSQGEEIQVPAVAVSPSMGQVWRNMKLRGEDVSGNGVVATSRNENNASNNVSHIPLYHDNDIDLDIPQSSVSNANTHVMIIANQNYLCEKPVSTALNDGRVMRDYCTRTLGIPSSQVVLLENRTSAQMEGDVEDFAKTIRLHGDDRFLFFYFGHGMHSQEMNVADAYLLPVDGSSQRLKRTGVSRNWMMEQFEKSKPSQMVVYLESCFSGATSDNNMLSYSEKSSGVRIKDVVDNSFKGNIVLFTASSNSETANALDGHNLFTYVFLKELRETKGEMNWGALFDKVSMETTKKAWDVLKRDQTPSVTPSSNLGNGWRKWKLIP